MDYTPPEIKRNYGNTQQNPQIPDRQQEEILWQAWQESIQPMIDDITRSERVTEKDLSVIVY